MISDAHAGLKAAIARVFEGDLATMPRSLDQKRARPCAAREASTPSSPPRSGQAFNQPDKKAAVETLGATSPTSFAPMVPKLAAVMDASEADVLAYMSFPAQDRTKLHTTNPLERLNREIKRRAEVIGIFPTRTRRPPGRRRALRAERRVGRPALPLHDP